MNLLEQLNWRYAVKAFDAEKKVSALDFETLLESIRLAPTSYGLQAFKVIVVENTELRKQLRAAAWNQSQVEEASHFLVFCSNLQVEDAQVDEYMALIGETRGVGVDKLKGFGDVIKQSAAAMGQEKVAAWCSKQSYIALGFAMQTAALLGIDTCPMEGFQAEKYNEILQLADQGLKVDVCLAVGYRSTEDKLQHAAKVRKPMAQLVEHR